MTHFKKLYNSLLKYGRHVVYQSRCQMTAAPLQRTRHLLEDLVARGELCKKHYQFKKELAELSSCLKGHN